MSKRKAEPTIEERFAQLNADIKDALAARDALIIEMRAAGQTHRAIAQAAGLSHTAVQFILKRYEAIA